MGINKRTKHIQLRFLSIQDLHQAGQLVLRRASTENNPADTFTKTLPAAHLQRHLSAVGLQTDVANEAGDYNHIFLVVDNKKQKQQQAPWNQQLRPHQALQVVQLRSATTTDHRQQRSGQHISTVQLSGGTFPTTTADNFQQVEQHQSAGSSEQQRQEQQTTSGGRLVLHNELFMIQHQAEFGEQPQDPPTSATTRSEFQRSSLEIIADAINRQQQTRGRRQLSPQPILTSLSTSSVGEMHQSQRSNDDNQDRGEATTKEEEERQQPRRRRQLQDIKKEEGSKDNKKEDIKKETATTTKKEGTKKEEKVKKEEGGREGEGRRREDRQRQRQPSSQPRRWTTTTKMTAALFFLISFPLFIFHLSRPLSESTGSTRDRE